MHTHARTHAHTHKNTHDVQTAKIMVDMGLDQSVLDISDPDLPHPGERDQVLARTCMRWVGGGRVSELRGIETKETESVRPKGNEGGGLNSLPFLFVSAPYLDKL